MQLELNQLDLVVRDMEKTVAFYRALGVDIPESAIWRTATGAHHVEVRLPGGFSLAFDSAALAKAYNRGWREPAAAVGARSVVGFNVAARDDVDRIHDELQKLGHHSSQPPFDAFWGASYAIVEDPDGNHVGIMSASDPARRTAPPNI
jgi:uncharacterized glyoxalase superfamily protein PhnB